MTTLPQTAPMRFPRPAVSSHLGPTSQPGHLGPAQSSPGQSGISLSGADVLRVLRANLWLIIIMLLASGVGGFFFNKWLKKYHSRYTALALVKVFGNEEIPFPGRPTPPANPAEIELVQRTLAQILTNTAGFMDDIRNPDSPIRTTAWFTKYSTNNHLDEAKIDLSENFGAAPIPNSQLVQVTMTCANPDDSRVIVKELVEHLMQTLKENQYKTEGKKIELLEKERQLVYEELNEDVRKKMAQKETALAPTRSTPSIPPSSNSTARNSSSAGSSRSACASSARSRGTNPASAASRTIWMKAALRRTSRSASTIP